MHLEQKLVAGRDEFCHSGGQDGRRRTGCISDKELPAAVVAVSFGLCEDDDVVHHGAVSRPCLNGLDPFVFREARIDRKILIGDCPFGGHSIRCFRHLENLIRILGQLPTIDERRGLGKIFGIAFRSAGSRPFVQKVFFVVRQAAVIAEVSLSGIGEPGRHAAVTDDFRDRVGPSGDFRVCRHRKRRDFSSSMARDAAFVEDPSNLIRIRHLRRRIGTVHAANEATDDPRLCFRHRLAGENLVDR